MHVKEQVILKGNTNGYQEYRIPGILRVKNSLLFVCEARVGGMGDWGDIDILVLRMEDGGEPEEMIKIGEVGNPPDGTMRTYNNPFLIPDGEKVHLIYHKNYEQAFIITSEDEGKNWSAPKEITATFKAFPYQWNVCATGPGHGIKMKSGRLVAPIWLANGEVLEDGMRRKHCPSVAGCIYSDDHGLTWQAGALTEGIHDANETSVVELQDGSLLFNFRNRDEDLHRVLGISADGGETFTKQWIPESLIDPMCMGGMTVAKDQVLFVNCDTTETRTDLTVKCSVDAGITWKSVWKVDPIGGYADITAEEGNVYIFYERTVMKQVKELVLKTGYLLWNES